MIKNRFYKRLLDDSDREKYHGDQSLSLSKERFAQLIENYKPVNINAPPLQVGTTESYSPPIEEIINFINEKQPLTIV